MGPQVLDRYIIYGICHLPLKWQWSLPLPINQVEDQEEEREHTEEGEVCSCKSLTGGCRS